MKMNQVLKALAHPIRRDIIVRLRSGPLNAGALAEAYSVSKPTMSTHFAALKEADLIRSERDGVTIYYHLNTTVTEEALCAVMELLGSSDVAPVARPAKKLKSS